MKKVIKMTWVGTLPSLLLLLDAGDTEGKRFARTELARMATAADRSFEALNKYIDKREAK